MIAALAADADLLILDEPTSGLDPLMEAEFQAAVMARAREGVTVLLSSHILAEVEALCDRVSIVREGRTVRSDTIDGLRQHAASVVAFTTATPVAALQTAPDCTQRHVPDGVRTSLPVPADQLGATLTTVLAAAPTSLSVEPPSLDALFLGEYREASTGR